MSRNITIILTLLFFASCGIKTVKKGERLPLKVIESGGGVNYNSRDFYAIAALDAKYRNDYKDAAKYFSKLYEIDKNPEFAYEAIKAYGTIKDYKHLKSILDSLEKNSPNDPNTKRFIAAYLIDQKEYKKALKILNSLPKDADSQVQNADESLRATALLGMGDKKSALRYFKKKYQENKSAQNALILFNILYSMGRDDEAIKLLQSHTDFIECDEQICLKLVALYKEKEELEPIIAITKRLYNTTKKASYAKMLLDLYRYKGDKESAIEFLKQSHFDDETLLSLYLSKKDYKSAKNLARKLYKESGDLNMLAQIAMIEYESTKKEKRDKKFLKEISKKFDKVVKNIQSPLYDNFYGYILIDDEVDVKRGIKLVKRALKNRPDAPFFIDSLAWGYYKLGECKKALKTIEPIIKNAKEKEILQHYKKIKECQ